MTALKSRTDTVRIVDWDELPERARNLPNNLNPFEEGVLMKHQVEWLKIKTDIKACPKGRRTGITFAESFDAVFTAAASKDAGGMSVYYIGDTKEKGLEFIGYCAKFSRVIAEAQGQIVQIEEFLFEDQNDKGETRQITAYRIRYASGFQIVALSSRPENIRGLQGKVVIDEAAFHPNVQGVMEAATALLIWGGRISVISSHNGKNNPFNQFVKDIENGVFGEDAKVHVVTFDDAVENGLYERVCFMQGKQATLEGKEKWYKKIRKAYGSRKAAMREELDAIPRDGSSVCLPTLWVERAMTEARTVLRLSLGDDFTELTPDERDAFIDDWIQRYLEPELQKLDRTKQHCAGQDYARHRDFSFILPFYIAQDLRRIAPFVIEMHKVPSRLQQKVLWYMLDRLPRFGGIAMDATGNGETLAENTAEKYGEHMVHQIKLSRAWYGLWTPKLVTAFEEDMIDLPIDADLKNDCSAIEEVDGIYMVSKARAKDIKDPELYRHGDGAVAMILGWFASLHLSSPIEFMGLPSREENRDADDWDEFYSDVGCW
ncbi:phage protein [Acinetobacter junii]|uniref:phage protein n=1 Tax=Acinetobacter junii TaxID=40215 RepID=UPI0005B30B6E|nr:phage protein [Acinetobacter junii]